MAQKVTLTNGTKTVKVNKNSGSHRLFLQRGYKELAEASATETQSQEPEPTPEPSQESDEPDPEPEEEKEDDQFDHMTNDDLRDFLKENSVNPGNAGREKLLEKARGLE